MHTHRAHRPFADEQLDVSIDSLAKNVVFFPLYYKLVLKIYKNIRHQARTCTFKVDVIEWPQFVSLFRVFGMTMWNAKRLSWKSIASSIEGCKILSMSSAGGDSGLSPADVVDAGASEESTVAGAVRYRSALDIEALRLTGS
jgi:hypothetical protein